MVPMFSSTTLQPRLQYYGYNREYRGGFAHKVARTGARFQVRSGER